MKQHTKIQEKRHREYTFNMRIIKHMREWGKNKKTQKNLKTTHNIGNSSIKHNNKT